MRMLRGHFFGVISGFSVCEVHSFFNPFHYIRRLPGKRELGPRPEKCFPFHSQHHSSSAPRMCSVGKRGVKQEQHLLFLDLFSKAAQIYTNNGGGLNLMQFVNVHFHGNK